MKKRLVMVLLAIGAITASVAAYYRGGSAETDPRVTTATVSRGPVVAAVDATGTLQAVTTVDVGTQVSGTIKALYADYNTQVRKGQVIAQLEPSLFETQVEQARATLQRLEAEVEAAKVQVQDTTVKLRRAGDLSAKQLIPYTDLETAQANARQAEASLKAAEAQLVMGRAALRNNQVNLGHTTITAPIDGIVISRNVDVGQTVAASMQAPTLFVLAQDLRHMQVNASVDEGDIGRIRAGERVTFRVDAYPEKTFHGVVRQVRLEPKVDQNVVSYITVIDVPNAGLELKPGMTANVTIETARADDVLRVPSAALRFRAAQGGAGAVPGVWTLAEGRLQRVHVEPGITDGTTTAIVGGDLREGAQVVTSMAATSATAQRSTSPLLPQRPGRQGQGGRPQGGAR